ncbi:MAG: class I adenylate-forming enzyme family protein [Spongiibacteraceae bacterium]
MNIHLLLEMAADAAPDRVAIGSLRDGWTYSQLLSASRQTAVKVKSMPGETLVYCGLNRPELAVAFFAASMAGRRFTPLNYRLPDADLRRLLERSAPAVALFDEDMIDRVRGIAGIELNAVKDFIYPVSDSQLALESLDEDEEAVAIVLFTSGTTSEPKAAILRHRHLTSYVFSTLEFMGADEGECALVSVPPYHIAGMSALITSIYTGRRIVQLPTFSADFWVDSVINEGVTHAMVVPTMLGRILDVIESRGVKLETLRALSYGGGRMPVSVIERAMDLLPAVDFVNAYGLTETSSTIAILDPESHRLAKNSTDFAVRNRLTSVGRPLPSIELEVRDTDGRVLPFDEVGEIWVRGDQISGEYEGKQSNLSDGWFPTKDSGWLDSEGYLFVAGRLDDVIVRGGENISPSEVEDVLRLHASVNDVAVLGVPDEEWGEKIIAVIVADSPVNVEDLKNLVQGKLRSTRVPAEILFESVLPYNETGKLLRRKLKDDYVSKI